MNLNEAKEILKENGYIVEGHWYDSTTGFRRYREDSDEREKAKVKMDLKKWKNISKIRVKTILLL